MSIPPTAWEPIDTDAVSADGTQFYKAWNELDDDEVEIDVAAEMATAEVPTAVTTTLWKLKAYGESDHVSVPGSLIGAPTVSGTVIKQRINSLERGRAYRLFIYFGAAGNRRSVTMPIMVSA